MNILFVNATRTWGGIKTWMIELGSYLARRGHTVAVACRQGTLMQAACDERGLACHGIQFGSDCSPRTVMTFLRLLRAQHTDVIVTNISKDIRTAGVAARLLGVAHVNRLGSRGDIANTARTRLAYGLLVDRVFVPSQGLLAHFGQFGFLTSKLRRFPNAVDPPPWVARHAKSPRFAVLAKLSRRKQVDQVIRAFSRVRDLPWELHIGGSGPELLALTRLAAELGLGERIHFACDDTLDFTKVDARTFLRDKDVGILYSDHEPFGWAILEYMGASCAVIASRVDGPVEIVRDNVDGLLVDPSRLDELESAIRLLITSPERREALARSGYTRVCDVFHQDVVFPLVEAELLEIVADRRRFSALGRHP